MLKHSTFCNCIIWRAIILNVTKLYSRFSPKIPKQRIFGSKFKNSFLLYQTLLHVLLEDADFKYDNSFSKLLPQTTKQEFKY